MENKLRDEEIKLSVRQSKSQEALLRHENT
jgi:hypothetical protein